jgi:hypothetical protein
MGDRTWNDEELAAAVNAYRAMQAVEHLGQFASKRAAYRELAQRFNRTEKAFEYRMQNISAVLAELGEPWIEGLKPASHVGAEMSERIKRLLASTATAASGLSDASEPIVAKAARFASVAVRPEQAAFRQRVFVACAGRCVISECDVPAALDAAHMTGKAWRTGQNRAEDGYLLRKDLHALYDAELLRIVDGIVHIATSIRSHYSQYDGVVVRLGSGRSK